MKSKQAKVREFSEKSKRIIAERDNCQCIFCKMGYKNDQGSSYDKQIFSYMHYIPRSRNGMGIPENGAVGCQYHHMMLDNGNHGDREEMLSMFAEYLRGFYPEWDESDLVYDKWAGLKIG